MAKGESYTSLNNLELQPTVIQSLKKARLTDHGHIMRTTSYAIQTLTGLSEEEVRYLKDQVAERHYSSSNFCTAKDLLNSKKKIQQWKLSSKCEEIDKVLRGGLPSGVVTEVTGESASGKTQLCLQLCISVQNNQTNTGGAVYICTEDAFPSRRLQDLIRFNKLTHTNVGDNIFIEHVADFDMLDHCIKHKMPVLLRQRTVKLIVIDSVTALFRCQYDVTQTVERAKHLNLFSSSLHKLAADYNIPIVCVNQVSSSIPQVNSAASSRVPSSGLIPSLGLAWANQVTCRLMLSKPHPAEVGSLRQSYPSEESALWTFRKLCVLFAPNLPETEIPVFIDHRGIHGFHL